MLAWNIPLTRFLMWFLVVTAYHGCCRAEWSDDPEVMARTEQSLHDYLQSASEPQRWAAFGRGTHWGANLNRSIQTEGKAFTLIAFSNKEPRAGYFAHGRVEWIYNDTAQISALGPDDGEWTQMLRHGERRYYKLGSPLLPTYREVDEAGKYVGSDQPWGTMYYPFNPFFMPIASYGSYLAEVTNRPQMERAFLEQSRLIMSDDQTPAGLLKGAWIWGDSPHEHRIIGVITFAEKYSWRPVSSIVMSVPAGKDPLEVLRFGQPSSRINTAWEETVLNDVGHAKKFFVPTSIRIESATNDNSLGEQTFYFRWKLGDDVASAFPHQDNRDWREPIRHLFDENFASKFDAEIDAPGEKRAERAEK